jgi:hypothetical protein
MMARTSRVLALEEQDTAWGCRKRNDTHAVTLSGRLETEIVVKAKITERTTSQPIGRARVSSAGGIQAITAMRTTERCGIVRSGKREDVYLKRSRPILLISAVFFTPTQAPGTHILTSNSTKMATKTNFMDLPAELRIQFTKPAFPTSSLSSGWTTSAT